MTAIRSPLGLVMIVGLFIALSIDTPARPNHEDVDCAGALIEDHTPIADAQTQSIAATQLLDVVRKRSWFSSILLDLFADFFGAIPRHPEQSLARLIAVCNLFHEPKIAYSKFSGKS